jgi:predicted TPR repeat methyltransferase
VSLLQKAAGEVHTILQLAEQLRLDGQLAPAVQAYLEVLEIDPSNAAARAALGPILRALRAPGRRSSMAAAMLCGAIIAAAAFTAGWWLAK